MVNCYRFLVKMDLSFLEALTKREAKFVWTTEYQREFEKVKEALKEAVVSPYQLGANLHRCFQSQDRCRLVQKGRIVVYMSKSLSSLQLCTA